MRVPLGHRLLHRDRAAHRIDDAGEFHQHAVAGDLDDAALVLSDLGIDQFAPMRLQPRKGPFLVGTHEPAVTRDISGEDGGQPAFDAFRGQSGALQPRGPNGSSALGAHSNGKREGYHSLSVRWPGSVRLARRPVARRSPDRARHRRGR